MTAHQAVTILTDRVRSFVLALIRPASPKSSPDPVETHTPRGEGPGILGKCIAMRRPCSILVLFVFLGFGVSLAVPAEDVPETSYDESEAVPYESTPVFSTVAPQASTQIAQSTLRSLHRKRDAPLLLPSARVRHTDAHRFVNERRWLALLCTLLC